MAGIVFGGISPHPPIIIPEVGRGEVDKVQDTVKALETLAERLKQSGAEVIVAITPHGTVFQDGVVINSLSQIAGNLSQFNAPQISLTFNNDLDLAKELATQASLLNLVAVNVYEENAEKYRVNTNLDHGLIVPLYYIEKAGIKLPLVPVNMALLPLEELYAFGVAIQRAALITGKKVAVIASGDLSHYLNDQSPYGARPEGKIFDDAIVDLLERMDILGIMNIDPVMCEKAGECGLRPIVMMLGAMDGLDVKAKVHSYEGPFGIGYTVATFSPIGPTPDRMWLDRIFKERSKRVELQRGQESSFVQLARTTLETYVMEDKTISPPIPIPKEFQDRAGVFVSLKKHGQLRGCIGTIGPTTDNVAQEIIRNAIEAGTGDPRFFPVEADELGELVYSVDVLKPAESIESTEQLDPQKYGVIVTSGRKRGLLLPNLEGVDTVEEQVNIAKQKAGIEPGELVQLERFEVARYH